MRNPRIYAHPPYSIALVHGGPGAAGEMAPVALHGDYDPHLIAGVQQPLSSRLKDFRLVSFEKCEHKPWIERHAQAHFYQVLRAELNAG